MELLERFKVYNLINKTFNRQYKLNKYKLFRYKQDKLKLKPCTELYYNGKQYVNVRKLIMPLGIGAMAFWKWKSDNRLVLFEWLKYKGLWYINKDQVKTFVKLLLKKQLSYYWKNIKEVKNGRTN